MDQRLAPLAEILRLNTKLFRNCLNGMSDAQAIERPTDATNHAAFVASHLTESRFHLLHLLGTDLANPLARYLDGIKRVEDFVPSPSLAEIQEAWTSVSRALRIAMDALTAEQLATEVAPRFPTPDRTRLSVLTFLVQHDSWHLGQLALLRKAAGLPAMRYS